MKKEKRAAWFKCFLTSKPTIDSIPDENVGRGLKAALQYFDIKVEEALDPLSNVVFQTLKPYIDEAFADYERAQENGQKGADARNGR